jgi:hypothetical protein
VGGGRGADSGPGTCGGRRLTVRLYWGLRQNVAYRDRPYREHHARAMPVARNASEQRESGVQVVYRADGSVAEIRGLADVIRAARMKDQAGEYPTSLPAIEGGQIGN